MTKNKEDTGIVELEEGRVICVPLVGMLEARR